MRTHKVQLQLVAPVSSELSLGSSKKRGEEKRAVWWVCMMLLTPPERMELGL